MGKTKARLILENGKSFEGKAFGLQEETIGEVIFNTSAVGYQEILSNPAYLGHIVVMTYPLVGNYGINLEDKQSEKVSVNGLIVREKCSMPNNWRCEFDLDSYLEQNGIIGVEGIDTRALTRVIRNEGAMRGIICTNNITHSEVMKKLAEFDNSGAAYFVTSDEVIHIEGNHQKIAVIDLGCRKSLIDYLKKYNHDITIFPFQISKEGQLRYDAKKILEIQPELVLVTNGPGNPNELQLLVDQLKLIVEETKALGIGLGCELLGLALGAQAKKLKYGHHGASHSIKELQTGKILIAECNYNYALEKETLSADFEITHQYINDSSIVGFKHKKYSVMGLEFEIDLYHHDLIKEI